MKRAVWPLGLLAVGAVFMFLLGFPLRTYMEQRASLARATSTAAALAAQNKQLQQEAVQLQSPSEIEYLARADYGLVQPGQEAYALLPSSSTTTTAPAAAVKADPGAVSGKTTSTAAAAAQDSSGGLWSRFVNQLEFWK